MAYVITTTNEVLYKSIVTKINDIYVRFYQNPVAKSDMQDGFLVALKKGDKISVTGAASYSFYIYE